MITSRSQRSPSSASASSYSTRVTAAQSAFRFPAARTSRFRSASLAPAAAPAAAASSAPLSPPDPTRRFPGPSAVRSAIVRSCAASRTGCSQRSNAASMSSHPSGACGGG